MLHIIYIHKIDTSRLGITITIAQRGTAVVYHWKSWRQGDSTVVSVKVSIMPPSTVCARPSLVAVTINTVSMHYHLIQPVTLTAETKAIPCVIM